MITDDTEKPARLLDIEIGVEADIEDSLVFPVGVPGLIARMNDHTLKGCPSQQLIDQLFGTVQFQFVRLHEFILIR